MADPMIEARTDRLRKFLTDTFRKQFGALRTDLGDKEIIESAVQQYKAKLRSEKAARTRKRRQHERTVDLFESAGGNDSEDDR